VVVPAALDFGLRQVRAPRRAFCLPLQRLEGFAYCESGKGHSLGRGLVSPAIVLLLCTATYVHVVWLGDLGGSFYRSGYMLPGWEFARSVKPKVERQLQNAARWRGERSIDCCRSKFVNRTRLQIKRRRRNGDETTSKTSRFDIQLPRMKEGASLLGGTFFAGRKSPRPFQLLTSRDCELLGLVLPHIFRFSRRRACALARFSSIRLRCSSVRTMASETLPTPGGRLRGGKSRRHRGLASGGVCANFLQQFSSSAPVTIFSCPVPVRAQAMGILRGMLGSVAGTVFLCGLYRYVIS